MSDLKPSPGVLWGRLAWQESGERVWHFRRDSGTRAGGG